MPKKLSHDQLQEWFQNFSKLLYEKVNIDITRKEDLGRLKIWYFTDWDPDEPLGPEGDFQYACIPHDELEYDNPAPDYDQPDARLQWMMDNLEVPVTDEQIAKLMEMSQKGTLMAFAPGAGDSNMQQVYTDKQGNVTISPPMSVMGASDDPNVPEHLRLPAPPTTGIKEPNPADFGLKGYPVRPEKPENMHPGFLSWLGYLIGINTDYAKLVDYNTFQERWDKWYNRLDDSNPNVFEFKTVQEARNQYLQKLEEFRSNPMGVASAIDNGRQLSIGFAGDVTQIQPFLIQEQRYLKNMHRALPQGLLLSQMEDTEYNLQLGNRTDHVVKNLLGHQAEPESLLLWIERRVFIPGEYNPKNYELPAPPAGATSAEAHTFTKKYADLAEIASFAALSSLDVAGEPLMDGFNKEETAKLNYSMILNNVFTYGRMQSREHMIFLEPGRQKGREAMEAYHAGNPQLLAKLLHDSILYTNREASNLSTLNSEHALGTLHLITRMWNTIQNDPNLKECVKFTPEEEEETLANMALYKATTKMLEAKKELLKYALYQREMTPDEIKQYGAELMFGTKILKEVAVLHRTAGYTINAHPDYQASLNTIARVSNPTNLTDALAQATQAGDQEKISTLQYELEHIPQIMDKAQKTMNLLELTRPCIVTGKNLMNEAWVNNYKTDLLSKCDLDKMLTLSRDQLGHLVKSSEGFQEAFTKPSPASKQNTNAQNAPQKEEIKTIQDASPRMMG